VTTTPMSGHDGLDAMSLIQYTHSIDTHIVAEHRMGYNEYVHGAYYGLKYRASPKRYRVIVLGLRLYSVVPASLLSFHRAVHALGRRLGRWSATPQHARFAVAAL
jgi:hypothetical protein